MKEDWTLDLSDELLPNASVEGSNGNDCFPKKDVKDLLEAEYAEGWEANDRFWEECGMNKGLEKVEHKYIKKMQEVVDIGDSASHSVHMELDNLLLEALKEAGLPKLVELYETAEENVTFYYE